MTGDMQVERLDSYKPGPQILWEKKRLSIFFLWSQSLRVPEQEYMTLGETQKLQIMSKC